MLLCISTMYRHQQFASSRPDIYAYGTAQPRTLIETTLIETQPTKEPKELYMPAPPTPTRYPRKILSPEEVTLGRHPKERYLWVGNNGAVGPVSRKLTSGPLHTHLSELQNSLPFSRLAAGSANSLPRFSGDGGSSPLGFALQDTLLTWTAY